MVSSLNYGTSSYANLYLGEEKKQQSTKVGPHEEESLQLGRIRCEHD